MVVSMQLLFRITMLHFIKCVYSLFSITHSLENYEGQFNALKMSSNNMVVAFERSKHITLIPLFRKKKI